MNGFMNKWRQYEQKYDITHYTFTENHSLESTLKLSILVVPDNTLRQKKGKQMTSPHHPTDERSG